MAIYKRGRRVEVGSTEKQFHLVRAGQSVNQLVEC